MSFIEPGPGQSWCSCCERLFTPAKVGDIYCARPDCLEAQPAFLVRAHAAKVARLETVRVQRAGPRSCGRWREFWPSRRQPCPSAA